MAGSGVAAGRGGLRSALSFNVNKISPLGASNRSCQLPLLWELKTAKVSEITHSEGGSDVTEKLIGEPRFSRYK